MVKTGKLKDRHKGVWLLFILFALGLACLVCAQAAESRASDGRYVATDWARRYKGPNGDDTAAAIALDGQGNIYVTGSSRSVTFASDFLTIKYSSDGQRLWARRYHSQENYSNHAIAIAIDGQGNLYVTGYSVTESSRYFEDSFFITIKYDSDGQLLWERFLDFGGRNNPSAMILDGQGNVYVTGISTGYGTFGDYATVKYSPDGQELWVRRYNGPGNDWDFPSAIAADTQGNVFVTGYSAGSGTSDDYATVKYSPKGDEMWVRRYNGPANSYDYAFALAVDAQGNVYVTGGSRGLGTDSDYATIKYNPEGQRLWVRRYNGPGNYWDGGTAIAVDAQGNVYVTGQSFGDGTDSDYATIKYSPAGKQLWVRRYNGPGNGVDHPAAMALDGQGNVYVTGISLGGGYNGYKYEYATIKYGPDGKRLWLRRYNGTGNDYNSPHALAVDGLGNVCVTGISLRSATGYDYLTIKYTQSP